MEGREGQVLVHISALKENIDTNYTLSIFSLLVKNTNKVFKEKSLGITRVDWLYERVTCQKPVVI
jgi:hypothetical protein